MEQWLPPNYEKPVSLARVNGDEFWTTLSPQRRARSPSRLTTFSDANGLACLESVPHPIMNHPSPNKRDPLADMLPDTWEATQKHGPNPSNETPRQSENKTQPVANAHTQSITPPSADDLALEMPWNSSSSSRKRPVKTRQYHAKPKAQPSKGSGLTPPAEPDKSTDSASPREGFAPRRSPRISKLIAHQKLQAATPPSSRLGVGKGTENGSVHAIPRKRKAHPLETEISERSGSETHHKEASTLPDKASKVPRVEQANPAETKLITESVPRPIPTNRDVPTPAEPEEQVSSHSGRTERHNRATDNLQSLGYSEESATFHHNGVQEKESTVTGVQTFSQQEETLHPPHEITRNVKTQPIYRDQGIQAFGSQARPEDDAPAETAVAGTQHEQRPSRKQAVPKQHVANGLPSRAMREAAPLPAREDIVPTHIAHTWDRLARRETQHQTCNSGLKSEADPVPPANHGEDHHAVDFDRSSSPLFVEQGPSHDDHQENGAAPWPPRSMFGNDMHIYKGPVSQPNTAFAQHLDLAYTLPRASDMSTELRETPVQHPQSPDGDSASSEQSRATSPEEVWRRETQDNSTYAIVHKIGMVSFSVHDAFW